jgi:hypothetical protein
VLRAYIGEDMPFVPKRRKKQRKKHRAS